MTTPNILVVDDTLENLKLLASMLGALGYEVRPVTNGRQALLAAERDAPDLVLLDINMPGLSGYEVCKSLKANPALADVPVVFLTALSDIADKVRAFEAGGSDYITKPFQIEEVHARVRTHLALREATRTLAENYRRLRDLEALRDDLVHMIVHDMRSPLMVMIGHLDLVHENALESLDAETQGDLRTALRAAHTLNDMANDLLDVSRLEQGKLPVSLAQHDLVEIATATRSLLRGLDHGRRIELSTPGPLHVTCDRELVRRVIENLVSNGVKHTPAGGSLRIVLEPRAGRVRLTVADEGPGIPPEVRARLFEKFATGATRTQTNFHSAGLGLAFCKLAIEAHGGTIAFEPREPAGSAFWFELDAASGAP